MMSEVNSNVEIETVFLGSLLCHSDSKYFEKIVDITTEDHFYYPDNREIFSAIKVAYKNNAYIHPLVVKQILKNEKWKKSVDNLIQDAKYYYARTDLKNLASELKNLYLRRQIEAYLTSINQKLADKAESTEGILESIESKTVEISKQYNSTRSGKRVGEYLEEVCEGIQKSYESDYSFNGIDTGFIDLNGITGGLNKSDLIILAGRPSMGKTSLAVSIAVNVAKKMQNEGGVLFFSLEMGAAQLTNRIIAMESGINAFRMRLGKIREGELKKAFSVTKGIEKLRLFIDDTPAIDVGTLKSIATRMLITENIKVVIIDYLQLLKSHGILNKGGVREQEVSVVTQSLKALAKELDIPVLALSQLSRAVEAREDKRPQLSDLRESGSIEQEADLVMFLYREAYYERRRQPKEGTEAHSQWQDRMEELKNKADLIVAKHRNGSIGTVPLCFNEDITLFTNL